MCAFKGCSSLQSVYIGKTFKNIDNGDMFDGCSALESLIVDEDNPYFRSEGYCIIQHEPQIYLIPDGSGANYYDYSDTTEVLFAGCKTSVIPDNVEAIGSSAFIGNGEIERIVIPDSVNTIRFVAFSCCEKLKEIYIGKNVEMVDVMAFSGCTQATIYCPFSEKPATWDDRWCTDDRYASPTVVWGYQGDN